ncbi:MAG: VWA domain-containing protein [Myxococcales bacterium]
MTSRNLLIALAVAAALAVAFDSHHASAAGRPNPPAATATDPVVQIALLLDTSSSMDGLIAQAKTQLWKVVNEFARARYNGKAPRVEVALYEYGNQGLSSQSGWIRQVAPLTTDLDRISEQLFALRTNGGDEYCGQVIQVATRELQWSDAKGALKMIFIAGNEPFTQGPVAPDGAVKAAIAKGIVVNTVFCGGEREGISTGWKQGALLADGRYSFIDSNQVVAAVTAPQDAEIAKLGAELNATYLAYGGDGKAKAMRQQAQDKNAESAGMGAGVQRAMAKASANYKNDDWDLVDAAKAGKVAVGTVSADALPEEMRGMNEEQRKEHVAKMATKRTELQAKIQKLEAERRTYVAAEETKRAKAAAPASIDRAMLESVHAQAAKADYAFE